ncbi:MAG: hypothetical protein LBK62_06025 [Treponema sp.]|jgi:hypothetical protein|nr:hypothetical protein [Treponema sp.]
MKNTIEHYQEILKHCMEEEDKEAGRGLGLTLIGLSHHSGMLTGFFVNPSDRTYLHIWEVRIDSKHIYSDTWKEVMLLPIDGYQFPRYVILLKEKEELNHMGFFMPESPKKRNA